MKEDLKPDILLTIIVILFGTLLGIIMLKVADQRQEYYNEISDCAIELRNSTGLTLEEAWNNCK